VTTPKSGGLRGYAVLLREPARRHLVASGLVARVPLAIVGFSVLFFVRATTGSFAAAGFESGVAIAANALSGPVFGRIADRRGQGGALLVAAIVHPLAIALLIVLGATGANIVVVSVAVLIVGASIAPAGAYTRARWSALLGADPSLHVAFSLEAIADELVWVFGPALAALIAGAINPAAGLVLSGVVGGIGCLWLRRGADLVPIAPVVGGRRHVFAPWRSRRIMALLVSSVALGMTFGVNDVTVVAWATDAGLAEIAGLVLTAYSIGSVTGGFLMGAIPARIPPYRLLLLASVAVGIFWSALALAPGIAWLFPLGLLAGATITPFTISANRVLHEEVHAEVFTEGVAWLSACVVGAMSVGSFVGGLVGQSSGGQIGGSFSGFDVVAISAPCVFVIVALARILPERTRVPA
jgi:MFS family permease